MGLMDNIRGFLSGNSQKQAEPVNNEYEKRVLADKIVVLVDKIKRINSFDSSIWNLSNTSSYDLKRKSFEELKTIHSNLERRMAELEKNSKRSNSTRASLEASKWTGEKPRHMSNHDFDLYQRGDDGR